MSERLSGLSLARSEYDAVFCDVWGVVHNGREVYPHSLDALSRFRQDGGQVVLITNSPRPGAGVRQQLEQMGAGKDFYDEVVTSGDVTRALISEVKGKIFHLGPERDLPLYDGLETELTATFEDADAVVSTGLVDDESEAPEDYRQMLLSFVESRLPFICANPDIVVERGDRLIWCAGALARDYANMGGETRLAGKPHAPIYRVARERLASLINRTPEDQRILCIGDGLPTDIAGAANAGLDVLYVSGGIHASEYGTADDPDEQALHAFLAREGAVTRYWMPKLSW